MLQDQVINYAPDLVIEIFFPDNDVYDEHPEHAGGSEWLEIAHGKREFWRPAVLYFYLEASLLEKGYNLIPFLGQNIRTFIHRFGALNKSNYVYVEHLRKVKNRIWWKEAWDSTFKNLLQMNSIAKGKGAEFGIIGIPKGPLMIDAYRPNKSEPLRSLLEKLQGKDGVALDFRYPMARTRAFARENGIRFYDFAEVLALKEREQGPICTGITGRREGIRNLQNSSTTSSCLCSDDPSKGKFNSIRT